MEREDMASPADSKEKVGSVDGSVIEEKTSEDMAVEGVQSSATARAAPPAAAAAAAAAPAAAASAGEPAPGEELTKVTVFNVGMHATLAQFEKILKNNSVEYKRAKKTPSITHGTLTFETAEQRAVAMEQLGKIVGARGGELMFAVLARQKQNNDNARGNKRSARDGDDDRRGGDASKRPRQHCADSLEKLILTHQNLARATRGESPVSTSTSLHGSGSGSGQPAAYPKGHTMEDLEAERKTVAQATASLYGVKTYPEQLAFKEKTLMDDLFLKLPIVIRNEWDKRFREWKRNQGMKQGGGGGTLNKPAELRCPAWCRMFKRRDGTVPFDVSPIVPAPEPEGYRNKCEFTLSVSEDGLATAGFRAGRFQAGVPITVESPKDCPQVHGDMKKLCVQMDAFMRSSPFPLYDDATKKGVWRLLVARRSTADKEGMAMVVINPTGVKDTEEWKKEEERLVKELSAGAQGEEGTRLVSLWVQEYAGLSSPDETSPMRLLWGKERLEEELLGLRFTISPNSFFQVNTKGAEALYKVVIENLELGDDAVVLDVCCGAGTIGICAAAAGGAKQVYGSDICLPAIEDARRNALANGIDNCEFVCGKAEAVVAGQIAKAFKQHKASLGSPAAGAGEEGSTASPAAAPAATGELKFAAIVDPPRSGVHAKCLRSIRGTKAIKRLVYVSCNPTKSLAADATILCTPVSKSTTGLPFRPVKAIPVDMFPHTPHMELVMVFERIEYETPESAPSAVGRGDPSGSETAAAAAAPAAEAAEAAAGGTTVPATVPAAGDAAAEGTVSTTSATAGDAAPGGTVSTTAAVGGDATAAGTVSTTVAVKEDPVIVVAGPPVVDSSGGSSLGSG